MRRMFGVRGLTGLVALALSGCAAQPSGGFADARDATRARTELAFRPGQASLSPGDVARVNRYLGGLLLSPQDDVVMSFGTSGSDVLDARRVAEARRVIASAPARLRIVSPQGVVQALPDQPDVVRIEAFRISLAFVPDSGL